MNENELKIVRILRHYQVGNGESDTALSDRIAKETKLSCMTVFNLLRGNYPKRPHKKTFNELGCWIDKNREKINKVVKESMGAA